MIPLLPKLTAPREADEYDLRYFTERSLTVERKYARWNETTPEVLRDAPLADLAEFAADGLLRWCRDNFLRPSSEVTTRMAESHADFFTRNRVVILAEVKATGLPPEHRLPPNWRARFKAWRLRRRNR